MRPQAAEATAVAFSLNCLMTWVMPSIDWTVLPVADYMPVTWAAMSPVTFAV